MFDRVEMGSPGWWPVSVAIVLVGLLSIGWSLWSSPVRGWAIWFGATCKLIAFVLIALYLVEPLAHSTRPKPGANALAIVVDDSRSMTLSEQAQSKLFVDKLHAVLNNDADWFVQASQDFKVLKYAFDSRLRTIDGFDELRFEGKSSALGSAVEKLRERLADRPTAGVLLFTDGISTDMLPPLQRTAELSLPIYPVVDARRAATRDIAVETPSVTQSGFELAPVQVEATVNCHGFAGESMSVRLFDERGTSLQQQTFSIAHAVFEQKVRFQFRPHEPGIQFVRVRARLSSEDSESSEDLSVSKEATTANNARLIAIDRGGGPYRILYLAGRSSWDFKFFRRAIAEDQELRLAALIRIAKKESKFNFRDRAVDSTNPLFAGFESDQEAAEVYDEPIIGRIGDLADDELKNGFPKTAEDLFGFDAIVLDDIEAKFFSQQQMLLVRQFVTYRGGGLLMLGGSDAFDRGGYRDTPIGDMLPVYLRSDRRTISASDRPDENSGLSSMPSAGARLDNVSGLAQPSVAFRLTREGGLQPWMRLRGSEGDEAKRISEMHPFTAWNSLRETKPGSSTLAVLADHESQTSPAMVTQNFGSGRVAALMVADMWRWSMRRANEDSDDLAQYWRQVARWLTSDVPRRVKVIIDNPQSIADPHTIRVELRDENFHPLDNAKVEVDLLLPDAQLVRLDARPDSKQPGTLRCQVWSQQKGPYVVSVKAVTDGGEAIGEAQSGWSAEPSAAEFQTLVPDLKQLHRLAEQSGGEVIDIDDLPRFVSSLPTRHVPVSEARVEPLWHRAPWLMLTIVCLCIEWGLRRWRGLP